MMNIQKNTPLLADMQTVTEIHHWTDQLFSFRLTRPRNLRFRSGEFVMIGLPNDNDRLILRAYSIASPSWDETLEFYSIKVPDGPLTSRLQHIKVGDQLILRPKPVGTLVLDALLPGKRLYMIATGTGIAPFASLLRDLETYERFDEIVLTHTCRTQLDLNYGAQLVSRLPDDPLVGEYISKKFQYFPTTTRENSRYTGRITNWLGQDKFSQILNVPALNSETDRVMICGSMSLNNDVKAILNQRGFSEGSNSAPQDYVVEKAFTDAR